MDIYRQGEVGGEGEDRGEKGAVEGGEKVVWREVRREGWREG